MNTEQYHKNIDGYLASLPTPSDKLTQFYDAAMIAKIALLEVDKLKKQIDSMHYTAAYNRNINSI